MAVGDGGALGYKSWIGLAEETSWSAKITSTAFAEITSENIQRMRDSQILDEINTSRNRTHRVMTNETVQGSIDCFLNPASDFIMRLIKNGMGGTATASGDAATGYSHYFYEGNLQASLSSFTLQKRVGENHIFDFLGCRVNAWSIKGEIGQPLQFTAEIIGRNGSTSTDTVTVALPTVTPLLYDGVTFYTGVAASVTSVFASGSAEKIGSFELTVNNNLIADDSARSMGGNTVDLIERGRLDVSLKFTQRFDTSTAYDRAFAGTAYAFGLKLSSSQTIGAGAGSTVYSMQLAIPKGYYKTQTPQIGEAGLVVQEIEIEAVAPSIGADILTVQVNNATASY